MSFYDNSSLAFLPSSGAGKDGKAYSVKPTDGTGDFTFSRGSNLAATRVGPTGLIEKGRENLLLQSNQFDTTWATIDSNVTSGQSGYDGSSNAWELDATTAGGRLYQSISFSGVHTFSIYAKKGTANGIRVRLQQTAVANAYIDLRDGSLFSSSSAIDVGIQDVSNGWYRITFALNASGVSLILLYPTDGEVSQTTGTIYIQDAQLEIGLAATDYIESGATTGKAGLLEDEPRFDYSGGVTCPSLLLEPSRTQLIPYSEYLNSLAIRDNAVVVSNAISSPSGLLDASEITFDGTSVGRVEWAIPSTIGEPYTISIYLKNKDLSDVTQVWIGFSSGAQGQFVTITNEWQRYDVTSNANGTNEYPRIQFSGTGSLYAWGFQVEQGSYPTSYIPNHSGGTITRGADSCTGAGDVNTFNSTEGVLYAEIADIADGGANRAIAISDGTTSNVVRFYYSTTANRIVGNVKSVGTNVFNFNNALTDSANFIKIALSYKANDFKMYVNGVLVATDTSGNAPIGLNELSFDNGGNFDDFYGKAKQLLYFPTALSDADCITLTT